MPSPDRDDDITFFAETDYRNERRRFGIRRRDRRAHMYLIGRTGMGKSTLLETLIVSDLMAGNGLALLDPHGDLAAKVRKALDTDGPTFLNVLMPCNRGWHFEIEEGIEMARMAVENCFWPIFEVENGVWKLNYQPKDKQPVRPWLEKQGRFRHLFKPGNEAYLEQIQAYVDSEWERVKKLAQPQV